MYPAYDNPLTVQYKGELKYPATQITTQQYRQTHASVQMPHHLAQVESRVTPSSIFVLSWGGSQRKGYTDPDTGISPCANRMGQHACKSYLIHLCMFI